MYVRAIYKEEPQILSYRVSELTSERVWIYEDVKDFRFGQNSLISVFSEDILRIEAWVRDERGTHEEIWKQTPGNFTFVPQVTLNKGSKDEAYDMMWMGYDEGMEADMYYVDINGFGEYSYEWTKIQEKEIGSIRHLDLVRGRCNFQLKIMIQIQEFLRHIIKFGIPEA